MEIVSGWFVGAAWLRFFRYLRMMTKQDRRIMIPAVGSTTERTIICVGWTRRPGVELPAEVSAEGAVAKSILLPRYAGMC